MTYQIPNYLEHISTNKFYSGMHWTKRRSISDAWHNAIILLCKQKKIATVKKRCIIIFGFNNKFDCDNNSVMVKMIVDGLVKAKVLKGDSKKYVVGITVYISDSNYLDIQEI